MSLFEERIKPRLEEIRICFETPGYDGIGSSNDVLGIEIVENNQMHIMCNIRKHSIFIQCFTRSSTMCLEFKCHRGKNLLIIEYDLKNSDDMTLITGLGTIDPKQDQNETQLSSDELEYLEQFLEYLQDKRRLYENLST